VNLFCNDLRWGKWQPEGRSEMSEQLPAVKARGFSIDAWAVLLAFVLAALVRAGVFKHIPW
jgi:hypothetical protein